VPVEYAYTYTTERINARFIRQMLATPAVRRCVLGNGLRLFDVLRPFEGRAHDEDMHGIASVKVAWHATSGVPGLKTRMYSGCTAHGMLAELLGEYGRVSHRLWVGCSAFAFSRTVRYIVRHDVPDMVDIDAINAHYRFVFKRMMQYGVEGES
jgi:hypothetical protein